MKVDVIDIESEEPVILELEDFDDEKVPVELVKKFEYDGRLFVLGNDLNDGESMYIFEVGHTEMGEMLSSINDEEEFNKIVSLLNDSD